MTTDPAKLEVESMTRASLDKNTKTTLATAVTAIGLAITGTWWVGMKISSLEKKIDSILALSSELALREAIENPGHRVPDPRDPTKVIVVLNGKVLP
jgi:hypothetical protein